MKTKKFYSILVMLFMSLSITLFFTSCSEDEADEDDGGSDISNYQGVWEGSYSGDDEGTFQVNISESGSISGTITSLVYDEVFNATGNVNSNGYFSASAGSGGISFTGEINGSSLSGSWENTAFGENGSFSGSLVSGGGGINPGGCDVDDEIAAVQNALTTFQNNPTQQTCSSLRQAVLNMLDAAQSCDDYGSLEEAYQVWLDMDCSQF